MFARTSGLLGVAVVLRIASASANLLTFEARDVTPIGSLIARQSTGFDPSVIPSACQSDCSAVVNDISGCSSSTDVLCGCTSTVSADMKTCFVCLINLAPTAQPSVQSSYDEYINNCNSLGANLPKGTIDSGSSTSGNSTSAGSSATGTATGSTRASGTSSAGGSTRTGNSNSNSNSTTTGSAGNGALSSSHRGSIVIVSAFVVSASFFMGLIL
ncbi:hypothetical protein L218DRAFT_1079868 [Marasmius fiardii PR-910]|nr:hypothetical protein L218DRAFT_1079868 [Marasmius fiardii PR-910]